MFANVGKTEGLWGRQLAVFANVGKTEGLWCHQLVVFANFGNTEGLWGLQLVSDSLFPMIDNGLIGICGKV